MYAPFFLLEKRRNVTHSLRSPLLFEVSLQRIAMMEDLKKSLNRPFVRYGASTVVILLAFLSRQVLEKITGGPLPPYITFFPAVMLVAMLGGFWPGIFTTLLSSFATATWILSRSARLEIKAGDQVSLGIFICAGFVMSVFADVYRETRQPGRGL